MLNVPQKRRGGLGCRGEAPVGLSTAPDRGATRGPLIAHNYTRARGQDHVYISNHPASEGRRGRTLLELSGQGGFTVECGVIWTSHRWVLAGQIGKIHFLHLQLYSASDNCRLISEDKFAISIYLKIYFYLVCLV